MQWMHFFLPVATMAFTSYLLQTTSTSQTLLQTVPLQHLLSTLHVVFRTYNNSAAAAAAAAIAATAAPHTTYTQHTVWVHRVLTFFYDTNTTDLLCIQPYNLFVAHATCSARYVLQTKHNPQLINSSVSSVHLPSRQSRVL